MMEKKTIRSGAPYVTAGLAVLAYALLVGIGSWFSYVLAFAVLVLGLAAGRKLFPDRVIEVECAPQSGSAEVDALIAEARTQLGKIAQANEAIADGELSVQIDDIENTCRRILARLEEQPEMLSSLRTFLRYYLPAVQKLLDARAKLEDEVNAGEIRQIERKISDAMAQVQTAFHKQLDALSEFRFINLESEMDVLKDMLESDGLISRAEATAPAGAKQENREDDPFSGLFVSGR